MKRIEYEIRMWAVSLLLEWIVQIWPATKENAPALIYLIEMAEFMKAECL